MIAPNRNLGHSDKDAFVTDKVGASGAKDEVVPADEPTVDDYTPRFRC